MSIRRLLVAAALAAAACLLPAVAAAHQARPPEGDRGAVRARVSAQEKRASAAAEEVPAGPSRSGQPAADSEPDPGGKKMTATPTRVPPVIDGVLDEQVWQIADAVSDFRQREPVEGAPASERTEVRILYDEDNIYVGFVLYDAEPDKIIATDLRRDSRLATDDTIAVFFDTFHDHRNGFLFRLNPLGTKYDATVKDEREINSQWDEKWEAAARITERGWEAEMQIPWKVLRYRTGNHVWGVDFKREIRRKNEEVEWSNYRQDFDFRAVSQMGHLVGLRGLTLTDRYRFKPYLSGGVTALNASDAPLTSGDGDLGVEDFKIQISPNLTADLTLNTDFAQVEDDQERVNLTRFPLFFPERREFFLEGADKFQFGSGGEGFGGPSALLYHSRNIGLFQGNPVPMRYGAKITGKLGATSVGFINAQKGSAPEFDYDARNYTTLRVKQDVLGRSSIGAIFTNVQGGGEYNRVGGFDANFRFLDNLNISGYLARSYDSRVASPQWIGSLRTGWNSDRWSANASFDYVDPEFRTDMGFIRRRDLARQNYSLGWKPRPAWGAVRQVMVFGSVEYLTDTEGEIETRSQSLWTRWQLESGDSFTVSVSREFERLDEGFYPSGLAFVGPGDYAWTSWRASVDTFRGRRVSGRLNASGGGFYDGTRRSFGARLTLRPNQKLSVSPSYDFNFVELPTGAFSTHVAGLRAGYNFSDRWLTSALVQYNSVAKRLSIFARLNYIYRTGDDFFLVYKSTVRYDEEFYGQVDQAVIAKLTRSWDF